MKAKRRVGIGPRVTLADGDAAWTREVLLRVWRDVADIEAGFGRSVVTIGNFDGVHLGHRHVIARAHEVAADRGGMPVVAVTFDPHPMRVIRPDKAPQPLTSLEDRLALLHQAGADAALVLAFTNQLADVEPEDFAQELIFDALRASAVVVGENFRFGHRARGNLALLTTVGAENDAVVLGLPLDGAHGQTWSSTYIRQRLAAGDVAAAAEALGRLVVVRGVVVRGDQRGRELGYPTANVPVTSHGSAVPADGVYAGWLRRVDDESAPWWPAAISVGTNPTFDGTDRRVESYVLDRDDLELYDLAVQVSFVAHLRGMVRFDSVAELVAQMATDVSRARAHLTPAP